MPQTADSFERYAAEQLLEQGDGLARTWTERITDERHLPPRRLAPDRELGDVLTEILRFVADFVGTEEPRLFTGRERLTETLSAFVRLRRRRGCKPEELIREFDLLAQVLDGACLEWLHSYPAEAAPEAIVRVTGRANRAPILLAEICISAFRVQESGEPAGAAERMRPSPTTSRTS